MRLILLYVYIYILTYPNVPLPDKEKETRSKLKKKKKKMKSQDHNPCATQPDEKRSLGKPKTVLVLMLILTEGSVRDVVLIFVVCIYYFPLTFIPKKERGHTHRERERDGERETETETERERGREGKRE